MQQKQEKTRSTPPQPSTKSSESSQVRETKIKSSPDLDADTLDHLEKMTPEEYERAKRMNGPLI